MVDRNLQKIEKLCKYAIIYMLRVGIVAKWLIFDVIPI